MSELGDYLLKNHVREVANNDTVQSAALEVIKTQDAKITELQSVIDALRDFGKLMRFPPTPPAQTGGK